MSELIGNNIKRIRTAKNITQKEMSLHLGVANTTISSWELGRTEPDMDMLNRIVTYFDCPVEDITGSDKPKVFYMTESEKEIIRRYRISPHQDAILSLLGLS